MAAETVGPSAPGDLVQGPHRTRPLPGAIGVSRLRVYRDAAMDGVIGGTPHVHLVCSEGYVVIGGSGALRTLTARGPQRVPLRPRTVAWFAPGTVHRLEGDGDLEIVTMMQNSGLPEAGDAVLTMPRPVLDDPEEYRRLAQLPVGATLEDAYRRRDLAVEGLAELTAAVERHGPAGLEPFYRAAMTIVRPHLKRWRTLWDKGPRHVTQETRTQLDALDNGETAYLLAADVDARTEPSAVGVLGMCGLLETYQATADEVT